MQSQSSVNYHTRGESEVQQGMTMLNAKTTMKLEYLNRGAYDLGANNADTSPFQESRKNCKFEFELQLALQLLRNLIY